uniref:Uncharacterized protein n=1 Tax=Arundo donax TaxID=35708 RepID=A0A0A9HDB9_ARUDO
MWPWDGYERKSTWMLLLPEPAIAACR